MATKMKTQTATELIESLDQLIDLVTRRLELEEKDLQFHKDELAEHNKTPGSLSPAELDFRIKIAHSLRDHHLMIIEELDLLDGLRQTIKNAL